MTSLRQQLGGAKCFWGSFVDYDIINPLSAMCRLYWLTKDFYGFGSQPRLAIYAKQLLPKCDQRLEHYPKCAGKCPA